MAQIDRPPKPTVADQNNFRRDLLVVIAGIGPANGQQIAAELAEYYASEITHARLYSNLDANVDRGFVEKGDADGRANAYTITEDGRRALENRKEWEAAYLEGVSA